MGGSPKVIQTQTQQAVDQTSTKTPLASAAGGLNDLMGLTQNAMNSRAGTYYAGDFLTGATGDATSGINALRGAIPGLGAGVDVLRQLGIDTASGKFLTPGSNPALQGAINFAIDPVTKQLQQSVLPGIKDQAISQGAYGGSRQDLQENSAVQDWSRTAGGIGATMAAQAYESERQRQTQAGTLLSQANALSMAPGQGYLALDEAQRQLGDINLQNQQQKFASWQNAPFYGLGEAAQLLGAAAPYGSTATKGLTSTNQVGTNPNYQSPEAQLLQGILGGAGTLGSLFATPKGGTSAAGGIADLFKGLGSFF